MLMNIFSVQHSFMQYTGLARDQIINTFHFIRAEAGDGDPAALCAAVRDFFIVGTDGFSGTSLVGLYYSSSINVNPAVVKAYKLTDAKPRPIVAQLSYQPATGSLDLTLPTEVAFCLSYHVVPGVGPVGRNRGRIYLGPLNGAALGADGRPAIPFATKARAKGQALFDAAFALGFQWCVYSPTKTTEAGGTPIGAVIGSLTTDDAWDTQRRRGLDPTEKVTEAVTA